MKRLQAILATALLLGLIACSGSPGGSPTGGPVTANVTGFWVTTTSVSFYKLSQSGSEVTGSFYHTLGNQSLALAEAVYECGLLGGQVSGRTLMLEIIMTRRNCPTLVDAGEEARVTISGEVRNDAFSGTVTQVTTTTVGGVESEETTSYATSWISVAANDPRVNFEID